MNNCKKDHINEINSSDNKKDFFSERSFASNNISKSNQKFKRSSIDNKIKDNFNNKQTEKKILTENANKRSCINRFIKSSVLCIPNVKELQEKSGIPLSLVVRPFARLEEDEKSIKSIEEIGSLVCEKCQTYINPYMQVTYDDCFKCNICQHQQKAFFSEYKNFIDMNNTINNKYFRSELHRDIYDIVVPNDYGLDFKAGPMHFVFLIDMTSECIRHRIPYLVCETLNKYFSVNINNDEKQKDTESLDANKSKFSIIGFDKCVYFFDLNDKSFDFHVLITSDLKNIVVPYYEQLFFTRDKGKQKLDFIFDFLSKLPTNVFNKNDSCFYSALESAYLILKNVNGGKIISILASMPTYGLENETLNDFYAINNLNKFDYTTITLIKKSCRSMADKFIKNNIGIDVFIISSINVGLLNLGWICSVTGGSFVKWNNFFFEKDRISFSSILYSSLCKTVGYQAQIRFRCSTGLKPKMFFGGSVPITKNSFIGNKNEPTVSILNLDQTFTILLEHNGVLNPNLDCHYQFHILYTTFNGIRKIRVINLVLAVCERMDYIFNFADEETILATIIRLTFLQLVNKKLDYLHEYVKKSIFKIFINYNSFLKSMNESNYNVEDDIKFPDSLSKLPLYILSFIKNESIKFSSNTSIDTRACEIFSLLVMPNENLIHSLYPALVDLCVLEENEAIYDINNKSFNVPKYLHLSKKFLVNDAYLLFNGKKVFLWIKSNSKTSLVQSIFGENIKSINEIDIMLNQVPIVNTPISSKLRSLIRFFFHHFLGFINTDFDHIDLIIDQIDRPAINFNCFFLDDNFNNNVDLKSSMSYSDWLLEIHQNIITQLKHNKLYKKNNYNLIHM